MGFGAYETRWNRSIYQTKLQDDKAIYLAPQGQEDFSDVLQNAITQLKNKWENGIIFIEEGDYYFSKTVYIPRGIRLIGYGKNRPRLILRANSPGYDKPVEGDLFQSKYLFWFVGMIPQVGGPIRDANPGTFYCCISNVNIIIEDGNPHAVAIRSHFAQHSFLSFLDIHIGSGKAGIVDVGNEMENIRFFGGDYGFYTRKPSPGWPFMMCDTVFEGQRKAAMLSEEAGLSIVRMQVKNVPVVMETPENFCEKMYMEDVRLENISKAALLISCENNTYNQINAQQVYCKNVPVFASYRESGKECAGAGDQYLVEQFTHGFQPDEAGIDQPMQVKTTHSFRLVEDIPAITESDMPFLPNTDTWVNVRDWGATGDGIHDDTAALQKAIDSNKAVYLPQGMYKVSDTILLRKDTVLVGLQPITTQILIDDNTEAFGGLGQPKAIVATEDGGSTILNGIAIDAGGANTRAVGCKWTAGADSYMNDVKFLGGHGGTIPPYNANRSDDYNPDRRWDSQYWSLWVTNNGGGVFKDVWTASTFAAAGVYISDTKTPSRVYAMSVEHHVRYEVVLKNVENWRLYALQTEEETTESQYCQPLLLDNCKNLLFVNLYTFRVIWVPNPYPYAIKAFGCENIEVLNFHNFTQMKHTISNGMIDYASGREFRPWQAARFVLTGKEASVIVPNGTEPVRLATGFDFADGIAKDKQGNVYFVDNRDKCVYKYSTDKGLEVIWTAHHKVLSLAFDTADNMIMLMEYFPSKKATVDGLPETYPDMPGAGRTAYGIYYHVGSHVLPCAMNPNDPYNTMQVLPRVPVDSVQTVEKALYPANRWRDTNDYLRETVIPPAEYFVAPDGKTVIPVHVDLIRANSLLAAYPNQEFIAVDEYYKRIIRFCTDSKANLSEPSVLIERGEYSVCTDDAGQIYVADCEIYRYNKDGALTGTIVMPERPSTLVVAGPNNDTLFVTTCNSFYAVSLA